MLKDTSISERLKELCDMYWDPPIPEGMPVPRWNSIISGTRKATLEELVALSEAFDVSVNYLVTGDELFPSLHRIPEKDAKRILNEIEDLRPEIDE